MDTTTYASRICRQAAGVVLALVASLGSASAAPLGELANEMQPGQWRKLNTNGDASGLSGDLFDARPGTVLGYLDKGKWDALSRRTYFIGQGHYGHQKFIQYDEATNKWSELPKPYWDSSPDVGHGYQHNTIDPATGDFYFRKSYTTEFYRLSRASGSWSKLPSPSIQSLTIAGGLEYFPEINGLVFAGRSSVSVFVNGRWTNLYDGNLPMGEYHNVVQYSPQHKVVYLGGGVIYQAGDSRKMYRIRPTLGVERIPDSPVSVGTSMSVTTIDPVTGNLLIFRNASTAHQFDGTSWSSVSLSGSPLSTVADVVAIPISTYGVVLFVFGNGGSPTTWLYKHSGSNAVPIDNTPPSVPAGLVVE